MEDDTICPRPPPLLGLFLVGLAVALAVQPLTGGDQYWHLSIGRWIWEHGEAPWHDPFSWTAAGTWWIPHEMLFDVVLEGVYRWGGLAGLRVLRGLLPAFFGFSLFCLLRRRLPGEYRKAAWLAILATAASLDISVPRPYWIPLILMPVLWGWIDRALDPDEPAPSALAYLAVTSAWASCHSSAILAVVAPGMAMVLDGSRRHTAGRLARLVVAGVVGAQLTPHPMWRFLLQAWTERGTFQGFVSEWTPPTLLGPTWEANLVLLACVAAVLRWRRRGPLWEVAFAGVWLWGYLHYVRQVGLALMSWAVLAAEALAHPEVRQGPRPRVRDGALLAGAAVALLLASRAEPPGLRPPHIDQSLLPTLQLDPFLETTRLRRLFHRFHWGGYLPWRSRNRVRSFIDGRVFPFGAAIHDDYARILMAAAGWEEAFDRYDFDGVLLIRTAPVLDALLARGGWREEPFPHPGVRLLVKD